MDDLISRTWLLDVVENVIEWDTDRDRNRIIHQIRELTPSAQRYTDEEIQKIQDAEQAMISKAFQLGQQDAQQWIPVSSGELPKDTYWVNVSILDESGDSRFRYSSVGWYFNGTWIVDNEPMREDGSIRVVAWCELPKPWEVVIGNERGENSDCLSCYCRSCPRYSCYAVKRTDWKNATVH